MVYAFLDTNVLLHYKVFEGMPWKELLADDKITFVICQKVFDEIDKHKDGDKTKLRNRAKTINKYLISYLNNSPISNLDIKFCPNPSKMSTNRVDFDATSSDEFIVFAAHEFDANDCKKVIVTGDGGMKLRAMKVGIETKLLNNPEYFITNELSEEEKRIRQLEKELSRYSNRSSKPVLMFEDESDTIQLHKVNIPDFSLELEEYRNHLKEKYPYRYSSQQRKTTLLNGLTIDNIVSNFSPYTEEDYDTYNKQIDGYIDQMVNLRDGQLLHSAIDTCIHEIKLSIFNKGTAPTGKMFIELTLPENLPVFGEEAIVKYDVTPPVIPQLLSCYDRDMIERAKINDMINRSLSHGSYYSYNSQDQIIEEHWSLNQEFELQKKLSFELPSLNHNLKYSLDSSKRFFIPCSKNGKYIIEWTINDESNIDPIQGQLIIYIE